jgi:hypothetical protein
LLRRSIFSHVYEFAAGLITQSLELFPVGQGHPFVEDFLQFLRPTFVIRRCHEASCHLVSRGGSASVSCAISSRNLAMRSLTGFCVAIGKQTIADAAVARLVSIIDRDCKGKLN